MKRNVLTTWEIETRQKSDSMENLIRNLTIVSKTSTQSTNQKKNIGNKT